MKSIRSDLLDGKKLDLCSACHYEDANNKVSGRQRQLLKSAVRIENFDRTFCASPHWSMFEHSADNQGHTNYHPVDLQIDLGNTCNSACIMCIPTYSSKLASDYTKLILIEPEIFKSYPNFKNWTDNPVLVDKFIDELALIPNIRYIHFLGGETLYLKSFYDICQRLIDMGLSKHISIGTTTNGTVHNADLEYIIANFKHVHLGVSIETATTLNDYIRYPGQINSILDNIDKFVNLRNNRNLHLALRITPNVFSIYHIDSIFRLMLDKKITAESCNILYEPACLRIELLPDNIRLDVLAKIQAIIDEYDIQPADKIINRRREDLVDPVISNVIYEYKHLLENINSTDNNNQQHTELVKYIKAFEQLRTNTILDYLPEYEEFLRSAGY